MLSKPYDDFKVHNPNTFFRIPDQTCDECMKKVNHICMYDESHNDGVYNDGILSDIDISEEDIFEIMNELPMTNTAGPDGLPSLLLRKCASSLCVPITILWRKSFNQGLIPSVLKKSFINPKFKTGGSKNNPASFRPLSWTSQLSKIFEKLLKKFLTSHLENGNLLGNFQHGFRKNRSCLSQMLLFYENILNDLENGKILT